MFFGVNHLVMILDLDTQAIAADTLLLFEHAARNESWNSESHSPLVISWIIQTDREENDRKHNSHGWIVVLYGGAAVCAAIPEQEN